MLTTGTRKPVTEANDVVVRDSTFFVAAGDWQGYAFDLVTGQCSRSFSGHSDYLHCLALRGATDLLTGSEDGLVKFWDTRTEHCSSTVDPFSGSAVTGPKTSHFVSSLALDPAQHWLAVGGSAAYGASC